MKGMILTAGVGSRLKPLTDKTPKALVKVADFAMLDLALAYYKKHGVEDVIINVHHMADQLMEFVAQKRWMGYTIEISDETSELLNTGGGLKKAASFFNGEKEFALMAVDILTDLDLTAMVEQHRQNKALVTLAVKDRETSRSLLFDNQGCLAGWKHNSTGETKIVEGRQAQDAFGFSGVHVISTKLFDLMEETGSFSIVDLYLRLAKTEKIQLFNHSEGRWIEFGRVENIKNALNSDDFNAIMASLG
jgi:NDP-sugar pyrophosphorylase family protein